MIMKVNESRHVFRRVIVSRSYFSLFLFLDFTGGSSRAAQMKTKHPTECTQKQEMEGKVGFPKDLSSKLLELEI